MGRTLPDVLPERHFGESPETRRKSSPPWITDFWTGKGRNFGVKACPHSPCSLRSARRCPPDRRLCRLSGRQFAAALHPDRAPKLNFEHASLKSSSESSRRARETFSDGGKLAAGRSRLFPAARSFGAGHETRVEAFEVSEQVRSFPAMAGSSRRVVRDFFQRREVSEQLAKLVARRSKFRSSSEVSRRPREVSEQVARLAARRSKFRSSSRGSGPAPHVPANTSKSSQRGLVSP